MWVDSESTRPGSLGVPFQGCPSGTFANGRASVSSPCLLAPAAPQAGHPVCLNRHPLAKGSQGNPPASLARKYPHSRSLLFPTPIKPFPSLELPRAELGQRAQAGREQSSGQHGRSW